MIIKMVISRAWIRHLLTFVLDDGRTYYIEGMKEVWAQSGQSGLNKRQATVLLTVPADGIDRV